LWASAAPDDPDRLVVCAFESDGEHAVFLSAAYVSLDAGNTWIRSLVDNHSDWVSETNCAAGTKGRAYFVAGVSDTSNGAMRHELGSSEAYRSWDGGLSWSAPRRYPFIDWMTLGVFSEDTEETVYLFGNIQADGIGDRGAGTWSKRGKPLLVSHDGLSFSLPVYPEDPTTPGAQDGFPLSVVSPGDGIVLALFAEIPKATFALYRSSGSRYERLSMIEMPAGVTAYGPLSAHMAMDRTGRFQGRLYAAIPAVEDGHPVLVLAHSADGGRSWSARVLLRRARKMSRDEIEYFSAGVAVNQDGVVGVEWLPGMDCPEFAVSTDGGYSVSERHSLGNCTEAERGQEMRPFPTETFLKAYNDRSSLDHPLQYTPTALPGLTIQVSTATLASVQIDSDSAGRFHVFWSETDAAGLTTYTTTVSAARSSADRISLEGTKEVTNASLIRVERQSFEERSGKFSIDLSVQNAGPLAIPYPTILEAVSARSDCGKVSYLNAYGTSKQGTALFRISRRPDRNRLFPGESSIPVHLEVLATGCDGGNAPLVDNAKRQALERRAVFPLAIRFRVFSAPSDAVQNLPQEAAPGR
jgi:hypothetical protein